MVSSHGHFVWYELVTTDVAAAASFYTRVMRWGAWDAFLEATPDAAIAAHARFSVLAIQLGRCPRHPS